MQPIVEIQNLLYNYRIITLRNQTRNKKELVTTSNKRQKQKEI
jgi:hypothetical protein